ncbi:MAG TPA: hypothetical protein VGF73_09540 [Chthoniobacterales bacterium]
MAASLLEEESNPIAKAVTPAAPPSLWSRLRTSRFLFISILVHLLFAVGAAIYVVQVYHPQRKLTFKGGPPSPNRSERSIEHKVQLAKKQSTMSAPAIKQRILTTGIAKVTLPALPAMPQTNDAAPMKMAGVGGAGVGAPTALSGAEGNSGGRRTDFILRLARNRRRLLRRRALRFEANPDPSLDRHDGAKVRRHRD